MSCVPKFPTIEGCSDLHNAQSCADAHLCSSPGALKLSVCGHPGGHFQICVRQSPCSVSTMQEYCVLVCCVEDGGHDPAKLLGKMYSSAFVMRCLTQYTQSVLIFTYRHIVVSIEFCWQ